MAPLPCLPLAFVEHCSPCAQPLDCGLPKKPAADAPKQHPPPQRVPAGFVSHCFPPWSLRQTQRDGKSSNFGAEGKQGGLSQKHHSPSGCVPERAPGQKSLAIGRAADTHLPPAEAFRLNPMSASAGDASCDLGWGCGDAGVAVSPPSDWPATTPRGSFL